MQQQRYFLTLSVPKLEADFVNAKTRGSFGNAKTVNKIFGVLVKPRVLHLTFFSGGNKNALF